VYRWKRRGGARSGERGFTLLEVLVAFTIASLLLVAVLRSLTLGLAGGARADAYTKATLLAESTLEAMGVAAPFRDGDRVELKTGPFRVTATVHRFTDRDLLDESTQYLALYALQATVSWREGPREQSISLNTLRLAPRR